MSSHNTVVPEVLKTAGRQLFNGHTSDAAGEIGVEPAKSNVLYILVLVTMGNAADLVLTVKTADDAAGTNATALTENVPLFVNDVKQTAAKTHTVTAATGSFEVVFCVPTIIVPADKFIELEFPISNAANVVSAIVLEDTYYNG